MSRVMKYFLLNGNDSICTKKESVFKCEFDNKIDETVDELLRLEEKIANVR